MKKKDTTTHAGTIVGIALITTILTMASFLAWVKYNPTSFVQLITPSTAVNESAFSDAFSCSSESIVVDVVKRANPAVVAITISKDVPVYEMYLETIPNTFDDFLGDDFFGDFVIPQLRQRGTELREIGGGSGFLVSPNGYIVTNRHVVSDEDAKYTVFTSEDQEYDAEVIVRDSILDLALIKINGSGFDYLVFGDSDKLKIGQTVIAIGNALAEFRNTVSVGVVSGLSRSIVASDRAGGFEAFDQLIQTDAGINLGNSGGPLINLSGEVVGVNVAVADGAEGIGFALNANSVKGILDSISTNGNLGIR